MSQPAKVPDIEVLVEYREPFMVEGVPRDRRLAQRLGQPIKVVWRAMERCWRKGLIECGCTLRSGWLTAKGSARLNEALELTPAEIDALCQATAKTVLKQKLQTFTIGTDYGKPFPPYVIKTINLDTGKEREIGTKHHWNWHMPMAEQVKCWCQPFVGHGPFIEGLVFHRPFPGYLFWEHGEQGPQPLDPMLTVDPALDRLEFRES